MSRDIPKKLCSTIDRHISTYINRSMAPIDSTWTNARGQRLHAIAYAPKTSPPKALICFHHGYAEHIGRYHAVFAALMAKGLAVHAYDAHAHGRSEPLEENKRVLISRFDHMVRDCRMRCVATHF